MKNFQQQTALDLALARAAHDMRNPLQVISGTAELLLLQAKDSDSEIGLQRIQQQADFMRQIIDDLVDFARPTGFGDDSILFKDMFDTLQAQVLAFAETERVRVHFSELPSVLLPEIKMHRISRILLNAINNAIASSHGGEVAVQVKATGDALVFQITDSGAGMEYNPADSAQTNPLVEKGLGIGIICALVARLEGSVCWSAQPSSCVTVEIPL